MSGMFGGSVNFNTSFSDISSGLFGDDKAGIETVDEKETKNLTTIKGLNISDEAIGKILSDLLSGDLGIANIFTKEKVAGLYDTTVAKREADNFLASVVGELAKLKAKEVTSEIGTVGTTGTKTAETESTGILDRFAEGWVGRNVESLFGN